jgi:uncharacterized membrane protein
VRITISSRLAAAAAYLFSVLGVAFVVLAKRKDPFAVLHAKRSLGIFVFCAFIGISWFILLMLLSMLPYVGFPLGVIFFAVVMAALGYCAVLWIYGIVRALRGREARFPLLSDWTDRWIRFGVFKVAKPVAAKVQPEIAEKIIDC